MVQQQVNCASAGPMNEGPEFISWTGRPQAEAILAVVKGRERCFVSIHQGQGRFVLHLFEGKARAYFLNPWNGGERL